MRPLWHRRRSISRNRTPFRHTDLRIEQLEDRVVPTVIDLTHLGDTGALFGAQFYQSSGTGIDTFVRLASNQTIEQGFNTNFRPVQFDESTNAGNTHAVLVSSVPTVISSGGLAYYEFLLNINQLSSSPLLSVDELRFYVTNSSTVDPTLLHNYSITAHTLQDDSGKLYSPVYDLNPATPAGNYIKLDYSLATGNGTGDMVALLPETSLGTDPNQYVYLYSELGVHFANNDGYDEWSTANALPVGSISGVKFVDVNGNGVRDAGDPAMAGITVFLDANNNGVLDPGEVSSVTAADGSFSFSNLLAGTYHVHEVLPAGYIQTASINTDLILAAGQIATGVALGNFKLGTISGTKFEDVTGNGFSVDDPVLNSANPDFVPVTLQLNRGSTVVATTTTDANGNYTFPGIGPGTYTVTEVKPNGWIQTAATGATIPATSGFASTGNNFDDYRVAQLLSSGVLAVRTTQTGSGTLTIVQDASNNIDITLGGQSAGTFPVAAVVSIQITSYAGFTVNSTQVSTVPVVDMVQPGNHNLVGGSSGTKVLLNSGSTDTLSVTGGNNVLNFSPTTFGVTFNAGMNQGQLQPLDSSGLHFASVTGTFQTIVGTSFNDTLTAALPAFDPIAGIVAPGTTIFSGLGQDTIYGTLATKAQTDGGGSQYTEVLASTAVSELQSAIQTLGTSATALAGFEASYTSNGGSSTVSASIMTNFTLNGTQNRFVQSIDSGALQVLQAAASFGGGLPVGANTFGTGLQVNSNSNFIQDSLLTSITLTGGNNTVVQTLDSNSTSLLESFGAGLPVGGNTYGTGVIVNSSSNFIQDSLLTSITLTGGNNTVVQTLDSSSTSLLESFGAGLPVGGNTYGTGVIVNSSSNFIQDSLLTSITLTGGNNQVLQTLDSNSKSLLESFGAGLPVGGNTYGTGVIVNSSSNFIQDSLLTTITLTGGNNTVVQTLDSNSTSLLESFGAGLPVGGNTYGTGVIVNSSSNFIQDSLLTTITLTGGNNTVVQTLDSNSTSLLESFGAGLPVGGNTYGTGVIVNSSSNYIQDSLLTTVTLNGTNNTVVQALDSNSTSLLEHFGAGLPVGGNTYGTGVIVNSSTNYIQAAVLTSVTFNVGNNSFVQNIDVNSQQLLSFLMPNGPPNFAAVGIKVMGKGGSNNAQAGILANIQLSGGEDTFVEQLTQAEVNLANTLLSNAASGGQAAVDAAAAAIGLHVVMGDGDDVIVGSLLGTFQAGNGNDRMVIEDAGLMNPPVANVSGSGLVPALLLQYGGKFTAGTGPNTFYLVGSNWGHVGITEPSTNNDTLDLSSIQAAGPTLDLSTTSEQQVLPGQLWLTLTAPSGIGFVVGNGNAATLKAGSRDVTLEGAAPLDPRSFNPPAWTGPTQYVFLDFTTFTTGAKHIYTDPERSQVLGQLQFDYAAFPFVKFATQLSQIPTGQPYSTLFFNKTPTGGEPGGLSDELDFRNLNLSSTAAIDVNGLLGGSGQPAATSPNFVAMSATIGAHELGHLMGLLHIDADGAIGFGNHNPPGNTQFRPNYPGPAAAWETTQHIIASPAAVGSSLFDTLNNPFFGEREAIKLAFIQGGTVVNEQNTNGANTNTSIASAQQVTLVGLQVPDTVSRGFNAGKIFSVAGVDVANASIQIDPNTGKSQSDYYKFDGQAGDLINIQALSFSLTRITDPVDTVLRVFDSSGTTLVNYYTGQAVNDDNPESGDAMIEDLKLPTTGSYYIEVDSFTAGPGDPLYDPHNPNATNDTETGHYELFIYRFQAGNTTALGGSNDVFIVGSGHDTILGRGGHDSVQASGATNYVLTNTSLIGLGTASLQGITTAILTGSPSASTTFDLSGWTGTATVVGAPGTTNNTLIVTRDVNFTLTNSLLTLSDGTVINLSNIQKVVLKGGPGANNFDVGGWTTGVAILDGAGGVNTVIASHSSASFVLTNSSLSFTGSGSISLTNIQNANLTGSTSGTVFDLRGWSGTDTLDSLGGQNPVITPRGVAVNDTEGVAMTPATASFTDGGATTATNYTSSIDWGDSTSASAGTVSAGGSAVTIKGNHTYKDEGTYTDTTTFSQGTLFSVIVSSTAKVVDAPLTASSSPLSLPQGLSVTGTKLATFTDANLQGPISDFSVTIVWGDGASSAGAVTQPGGVGTAFAVSGVHTYPIAGTDTVVVTIVDVGGQTASTTFTLTVQPSIFVLNPTVSGALSLSGTVGINIAGAVIVDSSSATALSAGGSSNITAGTIQVVGGVSSSNGTILSPAPITGITAIADPLAGLPVPPNPSTAPNAANPGSVNLSKGSLTINPGVYTQIKVSGTGTTLTMNPGVYIIMGGGFSVANSASVAGKGVMIYNAGSTFPNPGGTFGAISLGSSGAINLSAPTSGPYTGILIFQSRDNTRALSLNSSTVIGINGTVYAPAALLSLGGSATLKNPAIVGQLTLNGNGGSALTAAGTDNTTGTAGQLLGSDLFLFVNDPAGLFNYDELARVADTMTGLDTLLASYSVTITEVTDSASANLILDTGSNSAAGGLADGVLGCFVSNGITGEITLIQGWNWYTGADPTLIGSNQYDFQTILTHELGHALGLGHSTNSASVMYPELANGVARRTMTAQDLNVPDPDTGADALHAAPGNQSLPDESRDLTSSNRFFLDDNLASQSGVTSQSVRGFGFALADFSPEVGRPAYSPEVFNPVAFGLNGNALIPHDTTMSLGFGAGLPFGTDGLEETALRLAGQDKLPAFPKDSELGESLNHHRPVQSKSQNQGTEATLPPSMLSTDGPGSFLNGSSSESESSLLDLSVSPRSKFWDLEDSFGWLILGMFMIPSTELRSDASLACKENRLRGKIAF